MAKESGITVALSVDDSTGTLRDISNDITDFDVSLPRAEQDVTGLDKSAHERILLLADFSISLKGVYNDASQKSHELFRTIPTQGSTAKRTVKIAVSGTTLVVESIFTEYALARAASGELRYTAPGMLANGTAPVWSA